MKHINYLLVFKYWLVFDKSPPVQNLAFVFYPFKTSFQY
jgi:hypothetical protein